MNRSTLERLAPLTGILFVALFIASFAITGETPDINDTQDEVVSFWQDNDTEAMFGAAMIMWGSIFAVWFGGSLRGALRRASDDADRLAALTFAGWVILAVGACAFAGFSFAAADVADESNVPPDVIQAFSILGEDFFPILSAGLAIAMLAGGIATLRYGGIPRWLGYVAVLLGITAATPVGFFSFMLTGIWVIIVSIVLYRGTDETPAPAVAPPPAA
jgi:hypothetical protein